MTTITDENPYAAPDADVQVDDAPPGELAGRGLRLGGAIVDTIIMLIILVPILMQLDFWERALAEQSEVSDLFIGAGLGIGIFLLINGYLLADRGQTVGKMMLSMRIVSVHDGKILPFWQLIGLRYVPQWVVTNLPLVGGILALINVLFIFGEQRRCVHDLIAGTKVVMAEKRSR